MYRYFWILLSLLFAGKTAPSATPGDLIPVPVEFSLTSGSVESARVAQWPEKVKVSRKAILKRLEGRKLAGWQLKGAYWLEVGKRGVTIEAADEEGVFYARQSLKMLRALDRKVACCTILDWPRFPLCGDSGCILDFALIL